MNGRVTIHKLRRTWRLARREVVVAGRAMRYDLGRPGHARGRVPLPEWDGSERPYRRLVTPVAFAVLLLGAVGGSYYAAAGGYHADDPGAPAGPVPATSGSPAPAPSPSTSSAPAVTVLPVTPVPHPSRTPTPHPSPSPSAAGTPGAPPPGCVVCVVPPPSSAPPTGEPSQSPSVPPTTPAASPAGSTANFGDAALSNPSPLEVLSP